MRKAKKLYAAIALALAAMLVASTAAIAAVTFNSDGTGFVGKGDVQEAFGLNNKQLQDAVAANAISFTAEKVTENSWTCDRDAGPQTQERARTTTTEGVVSSVARERNQITGFNLAGFSGVIVSEESEGPPVNSCPTGWTAINQTEEETVGGLFVHYNGQSVQLQ